MRNSKRNDKILHTHKINTYSRIQRLLSEEDFNVFRNFTKNLEDFVDDKITASALWKCTYKMLDNHKDVWNVLRLKSLYNEFMELYAKVIPKASSVISKSAEWFNYVNNFGRTTAKGIDEGLERAGKYVFEIDGSGTNMKRATTVNYHHLTVVAYTSFS